MKAFAALMLVSLLDPSVLLPGVIIGAMQRTPRDALIWGLGWFVLGGAFHEMLMLGTTVTRGWWWPGFAMSGFSGFVWVWIGYGLIGRRRKRKPT